MPDHLRDRSAFIVVIAILVGMIVIVGSGCGTTDSVHARMTQQPGTGATPIHDAHSSAIGESILLPPEFSTSNASGAPVRLIRSADPPLIAQREAIEVVAKEFA
jgi:hypothetical protein